MITLEVVSTRQVELLDVSSEVRRAIRATGVRSGLALLFVPHTTAALTINENADPDVLRDLVMATNKLVPFEDGYRHCEGNSAAHLKCSLYGPSLNLIVQDGAPVLGTWQGIYFCEFDGPRRRQLYLKVVSG